LIRSIFLIVIIFFMYKSIDFDKNFDSTSPTIKIFQKIKTKYVNISKDGYLKTTLEEKNGIIIDIEDSESKLKMVEVYFKNETTNKKFLRFYKKFYINTHKLQIDLNKTILKKTMIGSHKTILKVVAMDKSLKENKKEYIFKITNKINLPRFEVINRDFSPIKSGKVSWAIIKTNKNKIYKIEADTNNVIFNKITENTYGVLFFHKNKTKYKIIIYDIYGNKYSKNIDFLKIKNQKQIENECYKVFKSLNIKTKNKITERKKLYNYKKGHTFSEGVAILKGKCNNTNYIIYTTNQSNIKHLIFGNKDNIEREVKKGISVKSNDFIDDFILYNNDIYSTDSYIRSHNMIFKNYI